MNLIDFILLGFGNFWMGMTTADIFDAYKRMKKCPLHYKISRRKLMHEIYGSMIVVAIFITANVVYYTIH